MSAPPEFRLAPAIPAEGYRLDTSGDRPRVASSGAAGAFYAEQTLAQLRAAADPDDRLPGVVIEDAPRFAWRGAMLDVARHFLPVEAVLAYLDDLAALKLNRLHLHLTDDQGWRIAIDSWPRLTGIGASTQVGGAPFDSGRGPVAGPAFYTKDDYRRIVEYAAERHIVVVPEIDLPGHTNAALTAYPELAPAGVTPEPYEGIEVGFSTLDTRNELTYRFVDDVVREVSAMTPGPWLHLGGDESLSTTEEDFLDFVARATAIAASHGKTLIGWHEMGRSRALPSGTIGQYWNFVEPQEHHGEHLAAFVEQGGRVVMSPGDVAYLDMKPHADHPLGLVWAKGPTSLRDAYSWEPTAIVPGIGEDEILGVEAPMFTETIASLADVREMAFPRLTALAEIMWSPRDGRSYDGFLVRLAELPGGLGGSTGSAAG